MIKLENVIKAAECCSLKENIKSCPYYKYPQCIRHCGKIEISEKVFKAMLYYLKKYQKEEELKWILNFQ
jgi:hypothetical protein